MESVSKVTNATETINDHVLYYLAMERLSSTDETNLISEDDVMKSFGITKADIDSYGEVTID